MSLIPLFFFHVFSSSPPFWRELCKNSVSCWFYTAPMIGEWMSMEHWQRASGRGNRKCWEKNLSTATLTLTVTHGPAWDRTKEAAVGVLDFRPDFWFRPYEYCCWNVTAKKIAFIASFVLKCQCKLGTLGKYTTDEGLPHALPLLLWRNSPGLGRLIFEVSSSLTLRHSHSL